jgi:regulator of protease activity HflC (stomatin/prohibitin superfamily)
MRTSIPLLFLLTVTGVLAESTLKIVRQGDGYSLLRNGQPYFAKGAVGAVHLEELTVAGGNSIRADVTALDHAQALGLSVLIDLPFGKQQPDALRGNVLNQKLECASGIRFNQ